MSEAPYALRGRVVTNSSIIVDGAVVIDGEAITWVGEATDAAAAGWGEQVVQAVSPTDGRYLLPGLVDVHCHGGGGASFPDASNEAEVMTAVMEHRRHGTTTMVASLVTASPEVLRRQAMLLAEVCEDGELAGIHFEGPFVSEGHCGAQNPEFIQAPNPALTRELMIVTRGYTVTMTLAPEKRRASGSGSVTEALIDNGALPSFGHTSTDAAQMREALRDARERLALNPMRRSPRATITHLFNGMEPPHHRDPGPIYEAIADAAGGGVILELIGDGVHVSPDTVRAVYEIVGRDSVVLVTDAMAAAGMADGQYLLGSLDVTVDEGQARLTGGTSLAGGTAHLLDVVRTTWQGGVPLVDAVFMATKQGARIIGDEYLGDLAPGMWADIVVVDEDLQPMSVYRRGTQV
ncbi:MAG: amidohydrolase family protein [Actinomycetaceae bacterium]|nr:amidohydrolase family protein [Actinomycetaceae bacterium]